MDHASELLIRAALHDLANVLAGVRGIVDLTRPEQPLSARDRARLEAVVDEGMATLTRSRSLAMGLLPDAQLEPGFDWRSQLQEELQPMAVLFRCEFQLDFQGDPGGDDWPGDRLRGYVRAVSRQVLPYVQGGRLHLTFQSSPGEWRIRWSPVDLVPETLGPDSQAEALDIASRWAARLGTALDVRLGLEGKVLVARIPRV